MTSRMKPRRGSTANHKIASRTVADTWARLVPNVQPFHTLGQLDNVVRGKIRNQAINDLNRSSGRTNFDWSALVDGFLDIGSTFGDLAYPGVGSAFSMGKGLYNKSGLKKAIFGNTASPKKVEKEIIKEVKQEVKREGVRKGARAMINSVRAPRQIGSSRDSVTFSGCDVIQLMTSGTSGTLEGAVMKSIRLNPLTMDALGLRTICSKYEEYTFNTLSFHLVGGAGTDEAGSVICVMDYDPMDQEWTSGGSETVRTAMTHHGAKTATLWQGFSMHLDPRSVPNRTFFVDETSAERRLTDVGRFYIVAAQPIAANVSIGTLYVDWTVTLKVRSDDNQGPSGDGLVIQATSCSKADIFPVATTTYNRFGIEPITTDHATGSVTLFPGSYFVMAETTTDEAKELQHEGSSMIKISGSGATAKSEYTNMCYQVSGGTVRHQIGIMWLTSTTNVSIIPTQLNVAATTATAWSSLVFIMATSKSPFGISLREYARLSSTISRTEQEAKLMAEIKAAQDITTKVVKSASSDPAIDEALKCSSSSSSCSTQALAIKPGYFLIKKS